MHPRAAQGCRLMCSKTVCALGRAGPGWGGLLGAGAGAPPGVVGALGVFNCSAAATHRRRRPAARGVCAARGASFIHGSTAWPWAFMGRGTNGLFQHCYVSHEHDMTWVV